MKRTKWRTVSCTDDGITTHRSQPAAYDRVASWNPGERFRVQYDEGLGAGWMPYTTVISNGDGTTDEE